MLEERLDRANTSLRRGGRMASIVVAILLIATTALVLSHGFRTFQLQDIVRHSFTQWLVFGLLLLGELWLLREGVRWSRVQLTSRGIEGLDRGGMLEWRDILEAHYRAPWLQFQDRSGRRHMLGLMFASSAHDVVESVQDHLPQELRLQVH